MTKDQARNAMTFLDRITLAPREIGAYSEVLKALHEIVNLPPAEEPVNKKKQ